MKKIGVEAEARHAAERDAERTQITERADRSPRGAALAKQIADQRHLVSEL
eukprot:gene583-17094_t